MRKTVLRSVRDYFIAVSGIAYAILWFPLGRQGEVETTPAHEPLWSLDLWGRVLAALGRDILDQAPVALPIGCVGAGLVVGLPVLAEEQGWRRADTLMPGEYSFAGSAPPSPDDSSEIWRAYDAIRGWASYLSVCLGLCAGIGIFVQFFLPVSTLVSMLSGFGLAVLIAGIVTVAAVGWCTTAVVVCRSVSSRNRRLSE